MAEAIGSLYAQLGLDSAQFDTGIAKARNSLNSFGRLDVGKGLKAGLGELEGGLKNTAGRAGILGTALSGMGLAGAAAGAALVGVGAAALGARQAFMFADDIADTASKLAVTTKTLQEYRYAVHALGGDYKDADAALEGFSKTFGAATSGLSPKALKPFKALGLDPQDFATTEEALDAVIGRISALSSTAEQAAVAEKLGLGSMIGALREGKDAIDEAREAANRLGFVMDDALVQKGGAANDRMEDLERVISVQLNSALVEIAPLLLGAGEGLAGGASAARSFFDEISDGLPALQALIDKTPALKGWLDVASKAAYAITPFPYIGKAVDALGKSGREQTLMGSVRDLAGGKVGSQSEWTDRVTGTAPVIPTGSLSGLGGGGSRGGGGGGGGDAKARREASERAIEQAAEAELSARMALTEGIERVAAMKLRQLEAETGSANRQVLAEAAEGKISKAAADKVVVLNNQIAVAKRELIEREAGEAFARQEADQSREINDIYDRIAQIAGDMAGTAAARNAIELKALADRQKAAREALETDLAQQVARDEITDSYRLARLAAQDDLEAAEKANTVRDAQVRLLEERTAIEAAGLENQVDLLASQAGLAATAYERSRIELKILEAQHEIERLKLEEVIASAASTQAEKDIAKARLGVLDQIQANETEAAKRANIADGISDVGDALSGYAKAFDSNTASKISQGFNNVAKAFATGGPIAAAVAAIGELGKAIGGKTGAFMEGFSSGGVITGILGVVGYNKAKKKAAAEAEAERLAKEQARLQEIANQKRQLELDIMEAQGWSFVALTMRRADELAKMNEANRASAVALHALQDAATFRELELKLIEATSGAEATLDARRHTQLAGMNPLHHAIQQQIWAEEDLTKTREAAARIAEEVASRQTDIQSQIDGMTLSSGEILAKTRAVEMAEAVKLDASLGVLLSTLYGLQDAATLAAAATEAATLATEAKAAADQAAIDASLAATNQARPYMLRLLEMDDAVTGGTTALVAKRADELAGLGPLAQGLAKLVFAREDEGAALAKNAEAVSTARDALSQAYERETSVIGATREKMAALAKTLRDLSGSISGSMLENMGPQAQYDASRSAFLEASALARLGNVDAAERLPALTEAFKAASLVVSPTELAYARDLALMRLEIEAAASTADRQVSIADRQLEALRNQVSGLIDVNESVMSVEAAIANLAAAMGASKAIAPVAGSAASGGDLSGFIARTDAYAAEQAAKSAAQIATEYAATMAEGLSWLDSMWGGYAGAYMQATGGRTNSIPGFAAGGIFTNGIVSQPTTFDMGMMGEAGAEAIVPLVRGPEGLGVRMSGGGGGNAELVAEMRALRSEIADLKAAAIQTTINTGKSARLADRWDGDGLPPERAAA